MECLYDFTADQCPGEGDAERSKITRTFHGRRSKFHVKSKKYGRTISTIHCNSQNLHRSTKANGSYRLHSKPSGTHVSLIKK